MTQRHTWPHAGPMLEVHFLRFITMSRRRGEGQLWAAPWKAVPLSLTRKRLDTWGGLERGSRRA